MVQIKKKVTLKAKTEQPAESIQQQAVQPTLREKQSDISTGKSQESQTPKKNGTIYLIGAIAIVALLCGGYYLISNQAETSGDNPSAQVTENSELKQNNNNQADNANIGNKDSKVSPADQAEESDPSHSKVSDEKKNESVPLNEKQTSPKVDKVPSRVVESSVDSNTESSLPSDLLEQKAKEVIRGNYGNGIERKQKLGDQYNEIQGMVNEMYKKGLVD